MRLAIDFCDAPYFLLVHVLRLPSELNTQSRRRARDCARFYSGRSRLKETLIKPYEVVRLIVMLLDRARSPVTTAALDGIVISRWIVTNSAVASSR